MSNTGKKTILIIDDEEIIRQSYTDFLEDRNYHVLAAENGRIGLEIFKQKKVDLILVDLRMPEMDGREVLSRISALSPNTPLIVVSGTGLIRDAVEALHQGAWDYVLKPIEDLSVLNHAVTSALEKAELKQENFEYQKHLEQMVIERTKELKKVNLQVKKDLREKEVLLKEIHHRVKNNLNVIISLLNLQCHHIKTKEQALSAFKVCRDRIFSMSLVHEKLYASKDFASIDMEDYIKTIAAHFLRGMISKTKVTIDFEIHDVFLTIDIAIPCGLIINELLTNALKHAFPDREKGEIRIHFHPIKEQNFVLTIDDSGIGLPDSIDIQKSKTLGLQIVNLLTEQIDGNLSIKRDNGTLFQIKFSIVEK